MRTHPAMLAVALALAILAWPVAGQQQGAPSSQVRLIEIGEFHAGEITSSSGEQWLGLFPSATGFALRPTTITVSTVRDEIVDEDTGPMTGKQVKANDPFAPIFLVRGLGLTRRTVPTVFAGELDLVDGTRLALRLGREAYSLDVIGKDLVPSGLSQQASLVLTRGAGGSQTLFFMPAQDDATWTLIWAGDLDGDGKLDLYADLSTHYNVSERQLFLSTAARGSDLAAKVGVFSRVGC